ncbi:MAG: hypothetical protein LLG04_05885 [Parachlamydia sp.]|nr:hypothetical protein [Parachlamydia sp.]
MSAPKDLPAVSIVNMHSLSLCYPQMLKAIEAQSAQHQFTVLQSILNILNDWQQPQLKEHIAFCVKLLHFIDQGVKEGKLASVKTNELMQRFVKAGVFGQLDPSGRVSQVQLCRRSTDSPAEKVSVALLPFMSSQFAQLLEHRLKQGDLETGLSLPARQALKHFLEKLEMPATPVKPGVLLELCRWEKEVNKEKRPFYTFIMDALDQCFMKENVIYKNIQPNSTLMVTKKDERSVEEKVQSLFEISTVQDAVDCFALASTLYGGLERYESCHILSLLIKRIVDFGSEAALFALNQIAEAGVIKTQDKLEEEKQENTKLLKQNENETRVLTEILVAKFLPSITHTIETCNNYSFDEDDKVAYGSEFKKRCLDELFRLNGIRTYICPHDPTQIGVDLQAAQLLTTSTRLSFIIENTFKIKSLMVTRANVALMQQWKEKSERPFFMHMEHVYSEVYDNNPLVKNLWCPSLKHPIQYGGFQETEHSKRLHSIKVLPSEAYAHIDPSPETYEKLCAKYKKLFIERRALLKKLHTVSNHARLLANFIPQEQALNSFYSKVIENGMNEENANVVMRVLRQLTHFDANLIARFCDQCRIDFMKECQLSIFSHPDEPYKLMVGLDVLPYMQSSTPLGENLRKHFDSLLLLEGQWQSAVEGRKLARLLEPNAVELPLTNITHLFIPENFWPYSKELFAIIPALKDKIMVSCELPVHEFP